MLLKNVVFGNIPSRVVRKRAVRCCHYLLVSSSFPSHYCFTCVTLRQLQMCPTEASLKGYPLKLDLTLGIGRVILVYGIRPDTPETCMYSTSPTARREIRYCKDTHPRERAESLRSVSSPKEKTQGTYRRSMVARPSNISSGRLVRAFACRSLFFFLCRGKVTSVGEETRLTGAAPCCRS